MRSIVSIISAAIGLGALTAPSLAAQKCHDHLSPIRIVDGGTATARWTVTRILKGPDDNQFCVVEWRSLGGHQQFSLVQPPRLGTVKFKDYRVGYRGEQIGHDTMVVKQTWLSRTNRPMSATVTYDITVVNTL